MVEVGNTPLPRTRNDVGIDLGLSSLAVLSTGEVVANPRYLRQPDPALARTRLGKSVHDAGWSILVRLLEEKATRCHRTVVKVGRWFPSSRLCSVCGFNSGKKSLEVRSWTCPECCVTHDRDVNAARNILAEGRKVAAGLAETLNARGGGVRPGLVPAAACEARTHQGAA